MAHDCEFGGDTLYDCQDCPYSGDYHWSKEKGCCVERPEVIPNYKELVPVYDTRKSFYGKAWTYGERGVLYLVSYSTVVACIEDDYPQVVDTYSPTTLRHIKEFLKQNGWKAESKEQILRDYYPNPELERVEKEVN